MHPTCRTTCSCSADPATVHPSRLATTSPGHGRTISYCDCNTNVIYRTLTEVYSACKLQSQHMRHKRPVLLTSPTNNHHLHVSNTLLHFRTFRTVLSVVITRVSEEGLKCAQKPSHFACPLDPFWYSVLRATPAPRVSMTITTLTCGSLAALSCGTVGWDNDRERLCKVAWSGRSVRPPPLHRDSRRSFLGVGSAPKLTPRGKV